MRKILGFLTLIMTCLLFGCATGAIIPKQIPDALNSACEIYTKAKPQVIAARAYAKDHWNDKIPNSDRDLIPSEVKGALLEFDSFLPKLDEAGLAICAAAEGITVISNTAAGDIKHVDWNRVLSVVMKGASMAIDLKSKGAF